MDFIQHSLFPNEILLDPSSCAQCTFLTPLNVVVDTKRHYIELQILQTQMHSMTTHCIPWINFDFNPPYLSYTICQKQFPLQLAYSTTFNSCQGLTFDCVVLDCHEDVFAHGQLY